MGRGKPAKDQLGLTNSIGEQQKAKSDALQKQLIPGYTSLMDTGYFSPEEEHAATTSEMGAATQPFESMGFSAANRAGATRNASDLTSQQDQLAMEQGQTAGTAAANLQKEKMANQMAGMSGMQGLQSEDLDAMEKMYGLGPSTLAARPGNPFAGLLNSAIQAGGAIGGAALSKPAAG